MFTIQITKTETVRGIRPKYYGVVGEKVEDGVTLKVYGEQPEIETVRTETVKVFEQSVEKLDLAAVIRAINGMVRSRRSAGKG